jgi:hypothetical protein
MSESPEGNSTDEIEVTPEMIEAGLRVLWDSGAVENPLDADRTVIREIFLAMMTSLESARSANSSKQ